MCRGARVRQAAKRRRDVAPVLLTRQLEWTPRRPLPNVAPTMAEPSKSLEPATGWPHWPVALILAAVHAATALLFTLDSTPGTDAALRGFPVDDAWIHLVYARSLGLCQGFAYNPGVQEAGSTSPLWALLLAPLTWLLPLGVPVLVLAVKLLGTLLAWLGSILAYRLAFRWTGSRASALAAGLLLAVDPSLTFAKVSGMEVQLAGVLALAVLICLDAGLYRRAGLALGLLPLARPEQGALWLPALLALLWALWRQRAPLRAWLWALGPSAVGVGAWAALCLSISGRPLPNTFYAKHIAQVGPPLADLGTVFGPLLGSLPWALGGSGLLLFGAGLWRVRRHAASRLVLPYALLFLCGIAWAHDLSQWQPFYWNRYFQPVLLTLLPVVGIGIGMAIDAVAQARQRPPLRQALAIAGLICALVACASVPQQVGQRAHLYASNCQNIQEMQVELGLWLHDHVPPGQWIASQDAGALRFLSDRPLVDLVGLNDHEVLAGHRLAVLRRHDVHWFIANPYFLKIGSNPRFRAVHAAEAAVYTLCECPDQRRMVVYEQIRKAPGPH